MGVWPIQVLIKFFLKSFLVTNYRNMISHIAGYCIVLMHFMNLTLLEKDCLVLNYTDNVKKYKNSTKSGLYVLCVLLQFIYPHFIIAWLQIGRKKTGTLCQMLTVYFALLITYTIFEIMQKKWKFSIAKNRIKKSIFSNKWFFYLLRMEAWNISFYFTTKILSCDRKSS